MMSPGNWLAVVVSTAEASNLVFSELLNSLFNSPIKQ